LITITRAIQEQLSDFQSHAVEDEGVVSQVEEVMRGALGENETIWWEGWKRRLRTESGSVRRKRRKMGFDLLANDEAAVEGDVEAEDDEMRILIKVLVLRWPKDVVNGLTLQLDIIVGSIRLEDQFEWDIQNVDGGAPEKFAEIYSKELGLSGEFK
jgi:SWI/SNF-related matrix-associated actin-dependent regulator of chromatin subfamily B protein 1